MNDNASTDSLHQKLDPVSIEALGPELHQKDHCAADADPDDCGSLLNKIGVQALAERIWSLPNSKSEQHKSMVRIGSSGHRVASGS